MPTNLVGIGITTLAIAPTDVLGGELFPLGDHVVGITGAGQVAGQPVAIQLRGAWRVPKAPNFVGKIGRYVDYDHTNKNVVDFGLGTHHGVGMCQRAAAFSATEIRIVLMRVAVVGNQTTDAGKLTQTDGTVETLDRFVERDAAGVATRMVFLDPITQAPVYANDGNPAPIPTGATWSQQ